MMQESLIQQAVSAYKRGQRGRARNLLLQFVETDQNSELAWLLLGDLYDNPVEQITALENALAINPENDKARKHLEQLKTTQTQYHHVKLQKHIQDALAAQKNGEYDQALEILRSLVDEGYGDEQVWLLISEVVPNHKNQIKALRKVLVLNPDHAEAMFRLEDIKSAGNDPIALGLRYEKRGNFELAIDLYRQVSNGSASQIIRHEAKRRLNSAKIRLKEPEFKQVDPRLTLGRTTLGPILLFSFMMFLDSGLSLLKIPLVLWIGWPCVVIGAFLVVLTDEPSMAYFMYTIWKKIGGNKDVPLLGLKRLGILFITLPVIALVVESIIRFQEFWPFLWN